jgi:PKD repeat protein
MLLRKLAVSALGLALLTSVAVVLPGVTGVQAAQPKPLHTKLVPDTPKTGMPRITTGEITDIAYLGNRVFVAGGFTAIRNNTATNTTNYTQSFLASYNLDTGLVDTSFRPVFGGGGVTEIELSPDGTKLFVAGRFSTVNGVNKRKFASINPVTGAVNTAFTANADSAGTAIEATDSTVYLGGQFKTINGTSRVGLAAVNATSGALVTAFNNNLSGGIGTNGLLTVQALKLSHNDATLMVVHTGRQIAGQDRYGVGMISTTTNQLTPWRTRLWDDNLQFVGGIQRAYAGDISPDDSYFVVTSGSGGDRPPISDTAVAFSMTGGDNMQPLWVSRLFDSVYSVAISETAVYIGGHFNYMESPSAPDPWPGLTTTGYGQGQGLAGYGLGDDIVIRDHIGALNPATGKALEWSPGSDSFEGNKAMIVTPRGLITGGDATVQGTVNTGRIAFYDFTTVAAAGPNETSIINPIMGRVKPADVAFTIDGLATATSGVQRVQIEVKEGTRYLQDDLVTMGAANTINANLASPNATSTAWSLPLTISGNHKFELFARTYGVNGTSDATKAFKKFETFGLSDLPPTTALTGPNVSFIPTTTFTLTGTAADDFGVNSLQYSFRDANNRYLQEDGVTTGPNFNSFRGTPDVIGATAATWSYEVTLPYESEWTIQATAVDTAGQSDLRSAVNTWLVSSTAVAPSVAITTPAIMTPPTASAPLVVAPGSPMTFSGSATDDLGLADVEISLRNSTTRENLSSGGTWGTGVTAGWFRITPVDITGSTYNWTYTTPFNLKPGTYTFAVRATDDQELTTSSTNQGKLTVNSVITGDNAPNGLLNVTGTQTGGQSLHLDLAGTATDDFGVKAVGVTILESVSGRYLQADGTTLSAAYAERTAILASPNATSTTWTLPVDLPIEGDWAITAYAYDTQDQQDSSTTGATARYQIYPGDTPPLPVDGLMSPTEGTVFTGAKILASGRFNDDQQMARAQIAIMNSANLYMNSAGTFATTATAPVWITMFLNSPGTPGSNFSYTSPAIASGAYTVYLRGTDQHGFTTLVPYQSHVTVTGPTSNLAPVAAFSYSCSQNVCTFDGRTSTDENASTLTYSWAYGNGSTGSGPVPTKTYTAAAANVVVLTVKDEYGLTSTATQTVTIAEPAGNQPPVPVINAPSCSSLVCNISGVGTADPNVGDTFTYSWAYGDGTTTVVTTSSASHTFPVAGTYSVVLTATDGWGKVATATRSITVTGTATPVNAPPTATIAVPTCNLLACTFTGTAADTAPGTVATTSWNFGDGTAAVTGTLTPAAHTYALAGTYAVVLTVTDNEGAQVQATRSVTVAASNNVLPVANFTSSCTTGGVCTFTSTSTDTAPGSVVGYQWTFGDNSALGSGATATHTYAASGTYSVKLIVTDDEGAQSVAKTIPTAVTTPNAAPVANFTSSCTTAGVCTFTSSSTDASPGTIASTTWNFGDATTGTGTPVNHTYTATNTYSVAITVTDNQSASTTVTKLVSVQVGAANTPPVASFTSSCTQLACTFSSTSTDNVGITGYLWTFPDGTTATTANASKTFATAGTYAVSLRVTDAGALTNTATNSVTVTSATTTVGFRASASTTGSGVAASIAIPATVVAGDQLLLFVTANIATTASTPAGWTLLATQQDGTPDMRSWVFTRTATAGGGSVSSTLGSSAAKSTRIVVAYSGAAVPTVVASAVITAASSTTLAAPSVTVPVNGSRVVRFWANKTTDATAWALPGGVTSRGSAVGTGAGHIAAAAGDAAANAGAAGAATATSNVAGGKGVAFSVVVRPA